MPVKRADYVEYDSNIEDVNLLHTTHDNNNYNPIIVPPSGPYPNNILLVGEGPDSVEAVKGKPFVGPSGVELDWYLQPFNISHLSFRKTNVCLEYTEGNPDPTPAQIDRYTPVLLAEIERTKPKLILAVGLFAVRWFIGEDATLEALHGIPLYAGALDATRKNRAPAGCVVLPCYHPAKGFYQGRFKGTIQENFRIASELIYKIRNGESISPSDHYKSLISNPNYLPTESYYDVTGSDLESIIYDNFNHIDTLALDTEGFPGYEWSGQICFNPGESYCLRTKQPDFSVGIAALDLLINKRRSRTGNPSLPTVLTHCSSTPQGTMYDIIMFRGMGLELSHSNLMDLMYGAYLCRLLPKGLKDLAMRFLLKNRVDYKKLVAGLARPDQIQFLRDALAVANLIPRPEKKLIKNNLGQMKYYQPEKISTTISRILTNIESGKLDTKGNPTDPYKRWKKITPEYRKSAEAIVGRSIPFPSLDYVPLSQAVNYACGDADDTLQIYPYIVDYLKEFERRDHQFSVSKQSKLFHPIKHPNRFYCESLPDVTYPNGCKLLPLVEKMQQVGMPASKSSLMSLYDEFDKEKEHYRFLISQSVFAGKPFNPNSPPQTRKLIEALNIRLDIKSSRKRTKTGQAKTDKKSIEFLRHEVPEMDWLFCYREYAHLNDSFINVFLEEIDEYLNSLDESNRTDTPDIGFVKTVIDPSHTEARRHATRDPNLLNVPSRTPEGRRIRSCFIAPDGWVIVSVDFGQVELRVMADESKDDVMMQVFLNGEDMHKDYASFFFRRPNVTKDERYFGKTMNFSIGYGMHETTIYDQLQKEGQKQWSLEQCRDARHGWFDRYKGVKKFKQQLVEDSLYRGYVRDRSGMIRYLPNLRSRNKMDREEAERHCLSHRIQGTAQWLIQNSMLWLKDRFYDLWDIGIEAYLSLNYHDELIAICREERAVMVSNLIKKAFLEYNNGRLSVPIEVDTAIGKSWGEL